MPLIGPIYSIEKDLEGYHNNSECTKRNNIEAKYIRAGTSNKRLCEHCKKLTRIESLIATGR